MVGPIPTMATTTMAVVDPFPTRARGRWAIFHLHPPRLRTTMMVRQMLLVIIIMAFRDFVVRLGSVEPMPAIPDGRGFRLLRRRRRSPPCLPFTIPIIRTMAMVVVAMVVVARAILASSIRGRRKVDRVVLRVPPPRHRRRNLLFLIL